MLVRKYLKLDNNNRKIKVLIDARIELGKNGGIEQALIGLADSFRISNFKEFDYGWLVYDDSELIKEFNLPPNSEILRVRKLTRNSKSQVLIVFLRKFNLTNFILGLLRIFGPLKFELPAIPEIVIEWEPDIIHFPTQYGFKTKICNVYQPHDFQHLHFPKNFSFETRVLRKIGYSRMLSQTSGVILGNEWTINDFKFLFPEFNGKIINVPVYPYDLPSDFEKIDDPQILGKFLFYPASYWTHKNHKTLLVAHKKVCELGFDVNLVLCGFNLDRNFKRLISKYGAEDKIKVLGRVTRDELVHLYKKAYCLVMPSYFESESLPVWEAAKLGTPILTAMTTAIPSQIGSGAEFFDASSAESLTNLLIKVLENPDILKINSQNAIKRAAEFTAQNTGNGYRYAYRQALKIPKDENDLIWESLGKRF